MTDLLKRLREQIRAANVAALSTSIDTLRGALGGLFIVSSEAADALESAGELPEPKYVYSCADSKMYAPIGLYISKADYDTLRASHTALAARLREREAERAYFYKRWPGGIDEIESSIDGWTVWTAKHLQRADQAETLNGLQAANITQLAAELTQAESRIAELEREKEHASQMTYLE